MQSKILKILSFQVLVISFFVFPIFVSAQGNPPTPTQIPIKIANPFNCGNPPGSPATNCSIMTLILSIVNNIIMPIAAIVVVMWIIWAGFGFLTAQGKPAEIEKAKQRLLWSLIGAGILLGAAGIANVVENTIKALIQP